MLFAFLPSGQNGISWDEWDNPRFIAKSQSGFPLFSYEQIASSRLPDLNAVPVIKQLSHLPVIADRLWSKHLVDLGDKIGVTDLAVPLIRGLATRVKKYRHW